MSCSPWTKRYVPKKHNSNPKISPDGKFENTFYKSKVSDEKIPFYKKKKLLTIYDKYIIFSFTIICILAFIILVLLWEILHIIS